MELSKESAAQWSKLQETLSEIGDENYEWAVEELTDAAELGETMAEEGYEYFTSPNYKSAEAVITRADERMFSCVLYWEGYYHGAHPDHWTDSFALDPATGEGIPFSDIIDGAE